VVNAAWAPPLTCCRCGASHRRRGLGGQDSAAGASLRSRDGLPVQVMAVADGHGSARHPRSQVGSRLACAAALELVEGAIAASCLDDDGPWARRRWRRWLAGDLPAAIHAAWLTAVEADWRRHGAGDAEPFSPVPYGSTLAVVVMTPCWWGYTGLGDWDLVVVEGQGRARLASEESGVDPHGGERTLSLCLETAPTLFASRSRLHALPRLAAGEPLALVLSTDGIRKSCVTDADFLRLCSWMAASATRATQASAADQRGQEESGMELSEALDRISSQGSGDDVTVAVGLLQGRTMGRSATAARP
jgi:hypothetical protein